MRNIVLTGGGTAGHVTPNIALIDALRSLNWQVNYIGSTDGVEQAMIIAQGVPYYAVRSGKLRRYFSWKNFLDPFNVLIGIVQAYRLLRRLKPQVIFSKGGYVALPVVIGAKLNHISVIAHESDMTPGLANRLSLPFVDKICVTFPPSKQYFKDQNKVIVTGAPLREQLFHGDSEKALQACGFNREKPCLLVMGGSLGAQAINECVRQALDDLCRNFQVIHLCGRGKVDTSLLQHEGYYQFEYVDDLLPDLFAASQLVISRAGSNSLSEILALAKPHILIPLPLNASRGDQIHNARYFQQQGISVVIDQENLTPEILVNTTQTTYDHREMISEKIRELNVGSATQKIVEVIEDISRRR